MSGDDRPTAPDGRADPLEDGDGPAGWAVDDPDGSAGWALVHRDWIARAARAARARRGGRARPGWLARAIAAVRRLVRRLRARTRRSNSDEAGA